MCRGCWGRNKAVLAALDRQWGQDIPRQRKSSYKPPKPLKKRTDKRAAQEREYKVICDQVDAAAIALKQTNCYFCGEEVVNAEHHHLKGRDGDLLTEKRYIKRVHTQCHHEYHNVSVKKILWWDKYLSKLQRDGEDVLYNIEKEKLNK